MDASLAPLVDDPRQTDLVAWCSAPRVLDLFSGIGGFSLGLERAGMRTVAFCEIDPYARRVLARHWPEVPCYDDVRTLTAGRLAADGIGVDVICGGFPCQDISLAGAGAGLDGERSGLWREISRLTGELRPRYIIVENVSALLGRGLDRVLGDLAALGYDAEWHCIPAAYVGAPHRRDRVWIIAYRNTHGVLQTAIGKVPPRENPEPGRIRANGSNAHGFRVRGKRRSCDDGEAGKNEGVAQERQRVRPNPCTTRQGLSIPGGPRLAQRIRQAAQRPHSATAGGGWWDVEPDVGRVADGVPERVDRLRCLGNAVVPQIPEMIARAIMEQWT